MSGGSASNFKMRFDREDNPQQKRLLFESRFLYVQFSTLERRRVLIVDKDLNIQSIAVQ